MRKVASSLLLACLTMSVAAPVKAASAAGQTQPQELTVTDMALQKAYGVLEETPNQRRMRQGQPIVASFPAPDYGEMIETPNARRKRLNLPVSEAETASLQR